MQTLTTDAAEFLEVAESLPIEMRVDKLWAAEADRRADEIRSDKVTAKPGDVFLNEARPKFCCV